MEQMTKSTLEVPPADELVNGLLTDMEESGRLELDELSAIELKRVVNWYRQEFASLNHDIRLNFLEQFMQLEAVSDDEALFFAEQMYYDDQEAILKYIYQALDGVNYIKTFQYCWQVLEGDEMDKIKKDIIKNQQHRLLLIAPFAVLDNWNEDGSYGRFTSLRSNKEKEKKKTLLEKHFAAFDQADQLIKVLIDYAENNSQNQMVRLNLTAVEPFLLIPYLEKLTDLEIISENVTEGIVNRPFHYVDSKKIYTAQELQEEERLYVELKKFHPNSENLSFIPPFELSPIKIGAKIKSIRNTVEARKANIVLDNFDLFVEKSHLSKKECLIKLLEHELPIFLQVEKLQLSNAELAEIFSEFHEQNDLPFFLSDSSEVKNFLDYARNHRDENSPDLEKLFVNSLVLDLQNHDAYGFIAETIKFSGQSFFDLFSENDRQKIIQTINNFCPELWLKNLSYVEDENITSLNEIIEAIEDNPFELLDNFDKIYYHLKKEIREKNDSTSLEFYYGKIRKLFESSPDLFLGYQSIVKRLYSPQEIDMFIRNQLTGHINEDFFSDLIDNLDRYQEYKEIALELLESNGYLFAAATEFVHRIKNITNILGEKKFLDLFLKFIDAVDVDKFFGNSVFTFTLLKDKKRLAHAVDILIEKEKFISLSILYEKYQDLLSSEPDLIKRLKDLKKRSKNEPDVLKFINSTQEQLSQIKQINNSRKGMELIMAKIIRQLDAYCKQNKGVIFSQGYLRFEGLDRQRYVRRDIHDYIALRPDILFEKAMIGNNWDLIIQNILGEDEYNLLIKQNSRILAFNSEDDDWRKELFHNLEPNLFQEICNLNPLFTAISRNLTEAQFYPHILKLIEEQPFAPLLKKQKFNFSSTEKRMDSMDKINEGFLKQASLIFLLGSHDEIAAKAEQIMALPEAEQREYISLCEFALKYGFSVPVIDSLEEFKLELRNKTEKFLIEVFGLEQQQNLNFESLNTDTINALMVYYQKICSKGNEQMQGAFKNFIHQVLNGSYLHWRQWGEEVNSDKASALVELKNSKLVPKEINLRQYEQWITDMEADFEASFNYDIKDLLVGIREVLGTAVADGHIEEEILTTDNLTERYMALVEPLNELTDRQKKLRQYFETNSATADQENEYKNLGKKIAEYKEENGEKLNLFMALRYLEALKKITPADLAEQKIQLGKSSVAFKKVFSLLNNVFSEKYPDFGNDLERIKRIINEAFESIHGDQKVSKNNLQLTDRVDLSTYTFIGEKPVTSCQHYDSDGSNNFGLLSYLTDPNVKIIQMNSSNGNIVARAILRLLEDGQGQPQLFMERVYSSNPHGKITEAMVNFAKAKAKQMGVGLYSYGQHSESTINANLFSNGSRSAYVYTDGGGGKKANGIYKINKAKSIE